MTRLTCTETERSVKPMFPNSRFANSSRVSWRAPFLCTRTASADFSASQSKPRHCTAKAETLKEYLFGTEVYDRKASVPPKR